jgi:hypothetical protein
MKKHDKNDRKSLGLRVETVRRLSALSLAEVAGGFPVSTTPLCPPPHTASGGY